GAHQRRAIHVSALRRWHAHGRRAAQRATGVGVVAPNAVRPTSALTTPSNALRPPSFERLPPRRPARLTPHPPSRRSGSERPPTHVRVTPPHPSSDTPPRGPETARPSLRPPPTIASNDRTDTTGT